MTYIGRFAPSPTGPLHFGSLVGAVASFLDARHHGGRWLVRMEDLDPPREVPGAADTILRQLESHGLEWDGEVLYQSSRHQAYHDALTQLTANNLAYGCDCNRKRLAQLPNGYDGRCRERRLLTGQPLTDGLAVRVRLAEQAIPFADLIQGPINGQLAATQGDPIALRRDGLFAYQLAVVVDDHFQQISHVIRGYDLLDSTARQIGLYRRLGYSTPQFGHFPVAVAENGQKLSKQNLSPSLDLAKCQQQLVDALQCLNHPVPGALVLAPTREILHWAVAHWSRRRLPAGGTVPAPACYQRTVPSDH